MKKSNGEKFIGFVNKNIGKSMTTGKIAKGSKLTLRRVQSFCKSARENSRKVKYASDSGRTIVYTFKKNLTSNDI